MKPSAREYRVRVADAEKAVAKHLLPLTDLSRRTQNLHARVLQHFLAFMRKRGHKSVVLLSQQRILRWMIDYSSRYQAPSTAKVAFEVVIRYLAVLTCDGLITSNPMALFQKRHGDASWAHIARVLKSDDAAAALVQLRRPTTQPGPLHKHIGAYIDLHCAVGRSYKSHGRLLFDLDRFLAVQAVMSPSAVKSQLIDRWVEQMTCSPARRSWKMRLVKRFFDHLLAHGLIRRNPVLCERGALGCRQHSAFKPYIYTTAQIAAILAKAKGLPRNHLFPLRPYVGYTIIAMLYALGLRIGEACGLRLRDADLEQNVLLIRQTKFHKSRMVPFGPRLATCLRRYLRIRHTVLQPLREEDALFVTLWRRPVSTHTICALFRALLNQVGLDNGADHQRPRVHDLRHTFAVHRLLRWYRQGVDVQDRLMFLSTFMGHVEIQSTEVYLTVTAELLREANTRYRRQFGDVVAAGRRS